MIRICLITAAAVLGLAACGEKPQTVQAAYKKTDKPQWEGASNPYVAPGWTPGDAKAWTEHLRARAQAQNEYLRTSN